MNRIKSIQWCFCAIIALFVSMGSNEARAFDSVEQSCGTGDYWTDSKCVLWNNHYYPRQCVQYRIDPVEGLSDVPFWVATADMTGSANSAYRATSSMEREYLENEETRYSDCWKWEPDWDNPAFGENEAMIRDVIEVGSTTSIKGFDRTYEVNCISSEVNLNLLEDDRSSWDSGYVQYPSAYSPSRCYVRGDKLIIDMTKIGGRNMALEESYSRDGFTVKNIYIPDVSKVMTEEGMTREIKNSVGTTVLTMTMPYDWNQQKMSKSVSGSVQYGFDGSKRGHRLFSLSSTRGNRFRVKPIGIYGTPEVWSPGAAQAWLTETGEDPAYGGAWFYPGAIWEALPTQTNMGEEIIELGAGETLVSGMDIDVDFNRVMFLVEVLDELDSVIASHLVKQGATPVIGVISINNGN